MLENKGCVCVFYYDLTNKHHLICSLDPCFITVGVVNLYGVKKRYVEVI